MFYDQDGNVCEPCLSCPNIYVEDIWYSFMCKAKECIYDNKKENKTMKMFSDCSGECCVCSAGGCAGACAAGHGDDYFQFASKEKIIENLDKGIYPSYIKTMIDTLKNEYGYTYELKERTYKGKRVYFLIGRVKQLDDFQCFYGIYESEYDANYEMLRLCEKYGVKPDKCSETASFRVKEYNMALKWGE